VCWLIIGSLWLFDSSGGGGSSSSGNGECPALVRDTATFVVLLLWSCIALVCATSAAQCVHRCVQERDDEDTITL
jgi:hypothetical protein